MVVNAKKLIIKILLKKEFIKKELPYYYKLLCKYQNKYYYYYNTKKLIKSNMKIHKVSKMLLENMLALDVNLYKKIKYMKGYKLSSNNINNKNRRNNKLIIKNKFNMISSTNSSKDCCGEKTSPKLTLKIQPMMKNSENIIKTEQQQTHTYTHNLNNNSSAFLSKFNKNENVEEEEKAFHYRSKSVTFVKESLEQIRLFHIFDPPNSITMTPTHYSTGKIDSNSLFRLHKRNRNDKFKVIPFTSSELKKNALYDHPVRSSHRTKLNMPYNLKMDFSFGSSSPSPKSSTPSSPMSSPKLQMSNNLPLEKNNTSNYKLSDVQSSPKEMNLSYELGKPKSPVLPNNYSYTTNVNVMDNSLNFVNNNKEVIYNTSLLTVNSVTSHKITPLVQLI